MIINRSAWWSGVVLFAMTNLPAQNRKAGKSLRLAPPEMEKLRRWKVGSRNRGYTKDQEDVHAAFSDLWKDRRLDTNRVFLYKGKPWKNPRTALGWNTGLRLHDLRHTLQTYEGRGGYDDRHENCWPQERTDA